MGQLPSSCPEGQVGPVLFPFPTSPFTPRAVFSTLSSTVS